MPVEAISAVFDRSGAKLPDTELTSSQVAWEELTEETYGAWNGVGVIPGEGMIPGGICTGSLIDLNPKSEHAAYVLTSGHCVDGVAEVESVRVIIGEATDPVATPWFTLNPIPVTSFPDKVYFDKSKLPYDPKMIFGSKFKVRMIRIEYATMKNIDIAVIALEATNFEIKKMGFHLYSIAKNSANIGTSIVNVGVPQGISGRSMPSKDKILHLSKCKVGESEYVKEGRWSWPSSFEDQCSAVEGMSGSPIFNEENDEIIGVQNSAVEDAKDNALDCTEGKPCVVNKDGSTIVHHDQNYAQWTRNLPGCFNERGEFNVALSTCTLPRR